MSYNKINNGLFRQELAGLVLFGTMSTAKILKMYK